MAALLWRSFSRRCYDLQPGHAGTFNQSHDSVSRPPLPAAARRPRFCLQGGGTDSGLAGRQAGSGGSSPTQWVGGLGGVCLSADGFTAGLKSRRGSESAQPVASVASVASPAAAEKKTPHTAS